MCIFFQMEVCVIGLLRIWPVQLYSVVVPADCGRKIPTVLKRILSEFTGMGREPMGIGSEWLPFS